MTTYKVDVSVDKQESGTTCWAAVMAGVLGNGYNQQSLVQTYSRLAVQSGPRAGQMDVTQVFDALRRGYSEHDLKDLHGKGGLDDKVTTCGGLITTALSAGHPVICGLTTYDRSKLPLRAGGEVAWRHMVLLYQYDDASRLCWYKDPARDTRTQQVYLRALLAGFLYMNLEELGPAKRAMLNLNRGIVARAFKLIIPG